MHLFLWTMGCAREVRRAGEEVERSRAEKREHTRKTKRVWEITVEATGGSVGAAAATSLAEHRDDRVAVFDHKDKTLRSPFLFFSVHRRRVMEQSIRLLFVFFFLLASSGSRHAAKVCL
jgi:hypothetical protein